MLIIWKDTGGELGNSGTWGEGKASGQKKKKNHLTEVRGFPVGLLANSCLGVNDLSALFILKGIYQAGRSKNPPWSLGVGHLTAYKNEK